MRSVLLLNHLLRINTVSELLDCGRKSSYNHRPYSRQVTEQLPLSGSFHSHHLMYLKASNAASSENHWFFRSSFYYTLSLYIAVLLWSAPSMHVWQLHHGVSRENQKQKTVYLTNFYLHEQDIWHRSSHSRKLTSVVCCALAQQCLFHCTFHLILWA